MTKKSTQNNLATKEDLKKLATKEDLKKYVTKTDLKRTEKSLRQEILRVEEKVENFEEKLTNQMKKQHDQVMNTLVDFVGKVKNLEDENTVGAHHTRELRVQIDDHEARITTLESVIS